MDSICIVCGNAKPRKNKLCCNMACYSMYRQHYAVCLVCDKPFKKSPSSDTRCCSPECASCHKKSQHKNGVYDLPVAKWQARKREYEHSHAGDKHQNAKSWVIQSPGGTIYKCRNLIAFIRDNPNLFDGTPKQAFDGFAKIKATMQGKRQKNPSHSWKGWTLVEWCD